MTIIKLSDDEVAVVSGGVLATSDKAEAILAFSRDVRKTIGKFFSIYLETKTNPNLIDPFFYMNE